MKTKAVLVPAVLAFAAVRALAYEPFEVTASSLHVRTGPGMQYAIIGYIHAGQTYVGMPRPETHPWIEIWYDHRKGYVHGSYVKPAAVTHAAVTASALNIRTGPGVGYGRVGIAPHASVWTIFGESGDWRHIWYRGAARWAHGAYLMVLAGHGTPSSAPPPPATPAPSPAISPTAAALGTAGSDALAPATPPLPTSSIGFLELPASGAGFTTYSTSDRRWGRPEMVYGLMRAASSWDAEHDYARIVVGDISRATGGTFPPHVSHRTGSDVDIRPVSTDLYEGRLTIHSGGYSSARTRDLITDHLARFLSLSVVGFLDPAIYYVIPYVHPWSGHDNHLHARIK